MTRNGKRILTWAVLLGFVAFLAWTTVSAQKVECEICVEFAGGRNCATTTGPSEREAAEAAQTTACGPLARGMNESLACGNTPPVVRRCRTR
jgi:hypothetical protein